MIFHQGLTTLLAMSCLQVELPPLIGKFSFRARRVQLGLSQEELAKRAGVCTNTIGNLERGKRVTLESVQRLAPHLGLTFTQSLALLAEQMGETRP